MLIELCVQNFRSISDVQKFSMADGIASSERPWASQKTGNHIVPSALRSACLFGANGSGKSNFVKALSFLTEFVEASAKNNQVDSPINIQPFAYDPEWRKSPTEIEVVFVHNKVIYQYGFIVDQNRVFYEWLYENSSSKDDRLCCIFTRSYNQERSSYDWYLNKNHMSDEKESWRNNTRDNALFLSTAVQLNSSDLRVPYRWLTNQIAVVEDVLNFDDFYSIGQVQGDEGKKDIIAFMNTTDAALKDIKIETTESAPFLPVQLPIIPFPALGSTQYLFTRAQYLMDFKKMETVRLDSSGNEVALDFRLESVGTQMLFKLAGPILDTLKFGNTLVVDEIHNNLHPLTLAYVVNLFASEKYNQNGAQLIFTSHDSSILENPCLHRDQVWFVDKHKNLSSHLTPLSSFEEKEILSLQKDYLSGRFGGIPLLNEMKPDEIQQDG